MTHPAKPQRVVTFARGHVSRRHPRLSSIIDTNVAAARTRQKSLARSVNNKSYRRCARAVSMPFCTRYNWTQKTRHHWLECVFVRVCVCAPLTSARAPSLCTLSPSLFLSVVAHALAAGCGRSPIVGAVVVVDVVGIIIIIIIDGTASVAVSLVRATTRTQLQIQWDLADIALYFSLSFLVFCSWVYVWRQSNAITVRHDWSRAEVTLIWGTTLPVVTIWDGCWSTGY